MLTDVLGFQRGINFMLCTMSEIFKNTSILAIKIVPACRFTHSSPTWVPAEWLNIVPRGTMHHAIVLEHLYHRDAALLLHLSLFFSLSRVAAQAIKALGITQPVLPGPRMAALPFEPRRSPGQHGLTS